MSNIVERLRETTHKTFYIGTMADAADEITRLRARVAELEKALAEANEEADVREGDTLVGQIKMYLQHRHDLALQNITLRKRVAELEAAQEWRPIESAPRDGAVFLAVDARTQSHRVVWYDDEAKPPFVWHVDDAAKGFNHHADFFTHWLPLPAPPKVAT